MTAEFDQYGLEQGYARVRLLRDGEDDPFFEEGDGLAIGRYAGEKKEEYLCKAPLSGGQKWSGNAEALSLSASPDGDGVVFLLPPDYVDSMDDGNYIVRILGKDGSQKNMTIMPAYDVSHSPLRDANVSFAGQVPPVDTPAQGPVVPPVRLTPMNGGSSGGSSEGGSTQGGSSEGGPSEGGSTQGGTAEGDKPVAPTPPEGGMVPQPEAPQKKGKGLLIGGLVVAALLAAGAGYMLTSGGPDKSASSPEISQPAESTPAPAEPAPAPAEPVPAEPAAEPAPEPAPAPAESAPAEPAAEPAPAPAEPAEPAPVARSAWDQVMEFMQGDRNADAAMELAATLPTENDQDKDAVARLYYLAAEKGHPEGLKRYLDCIDPTKPAWGSMPKLGADAWHLYGKLPDGENSRQTLKQWAQDEAAKGSREAAEWLKEMR